VGKPHRSARRVVGGRGAHRLTRALVALAVLAGSCGLIALGSPARSRAQDLPPERDPIESSRYSIDLYEGPVLSGTRMSGLAGSYVAIAEDTDGSFQNPASPALRSAHSFREFDYGLGVGVTFPFFVRDFFNSGPTGSTRRYDDTEFFFVAPSLNLQFDRLGLGLNVRGQSYRLGDSEAPDSDNDGELRAQFFKIDAQIAYQFVDGQLILGAGGRIFVQRVIAGPGAFVNNRPLYTSTGFGLEAGALWRPNEQHYRLGLAFRSTIETTPNPSPGIESGDDDLVVGENFFLPRSIVLPWELDLGAAYQFGSRPFNPRWVSVEEVIAVDLRKFQARRIARERDTFERMRLARTQPGVDLEERLQEILEDRDRQEESDQDALDALRDRVVREMRSEFRRQERRYVLVTGSVLFTGRTANGVGVESFLQQEVQRSGEKIVLSPRLGVETEAWPNRLKTRAGVYLEPSRFSRGDTRLHATLGFDVRLFAWNVFHLWPDDYIWQASGAVDLARDYFVWSVALGGWY